jgi:SAM-dependent methyltransferase
MDGAEPSGALTEGDRAALYESYASTHAGLSVPAAEDREFRRDILPHLPPVAEDASVLDLGCGQGGLVAQLKRHGYARASGVDVSPEQVALAHARGLSSVVEGDYRDTLLENKYDVITATDFLEHLTKHEVVQAFRFVAGALESQGLFILRVPNAESPFSGRIQYGDFTHESRFTARSLRQIASSAGFSRCEFLPCPPIVHGPASLLRRTIWGAYSGVLKLGFAADSGILRGHIVTPNLTAVLRT